MCVAMAMNLRLSDEQTELLRARAEKEGRSMQQVALTAVDDYLLRAEDDELTDHLAERGAQRFANLLRRLGE
jgi:predicted transcriptional regulator